MDRNTLTVYVNGEEVVETEDDAEFESGEVSLLGDYGSDKGPGAEVLFDNFQVSTL